MIYIKSYQPLVNLTTILIYDKIKFKWVPLIENDVKDLEL